MSTIAKAINALNEENGNTYQVTYSGEEPITAEEYASVQFISGADENNQAIFMDSQPYTWDEVSTKKDAVVVEDNLSELRTERNAKLAETDWVITMHKELGTNIPAAWKTYRQALRDITDTYTSLDDVVWPEKP
jgi:translation elongation factor P/translation initiation factor 5A